MWLKPSNLREFHDHHLQEKLPGTCEWIWSHPMFLRWSNISTDSPADDRILHISGIPGCGKTILASSIVDSMKTRGDRVLFFSFSGTDASRQAIDSLVRSLLWQLLQESTSDESFNIVRDLMFKGPPLTSELWNALNRVSMSIQMCWVIDGVDECKGSGPALCKHVYTFLNAHKEIRAILLGRPHALEPVGLAKYTIKIEPNLIKSDVDKFIHTEISKSTNLQSLGLRDLAFETLQKGSHGMFLWVKFMVNDLNKPSSKAELIERLNNLPNGLQRAYRYLLSQLVDPLDHIDRRFTRDLLAFIISARRPLKLEELQYALAIASWSSRKSSNACSLQDCMVGDLARKVLHVCGSLVHINDGIISIVHLSAKEFLTRPESDWSCEDDHKIACLRIDPEESHYLFGSTCLDYLGIGGYGFPLISDDPSALWDGHPLLEYASKSVIYHLNRTGSFGENLLDKVHRFSGSEACLSWVEYFSMHLLEDATTGSEAAEFQTFMSWLGRKERQGEISEHFQTLLDHELEKRQRNFGESDWRSEQLRMFIDMIRDDNAAESMDAVSIAQPKAFNAAVLRASNDPISKLSETIEVLKHSGPLPMPIQVNLLLKLRCHLRQSKFLTDPLELLFRAILRNTAVFPVYALILIGKFTCGVKRYDMALELYHAALAKFKNHNVPMEYFVWHEIGYAKYCLGRYREAEEVFRRAIEGRERTLGAEHKDTLTSVDWLGEALYLQGKYVEAEEMFRRAIEGRERILGAEHELTLASVHWLGQALCKQDKSAEAEEMLRRAMEGRERTLGAEHKDTLTSVDSLGEVLYLQGKYVEAEEMLRRAMEGRERILGVKHELTLNSVEWLGMTLYRQRKYVEAEEMFRRAEGRQIN